MSFDLTDDDIISWIGRLIGASVGQDEMEDATLALEDRALFEDYVRRVLAIESPALGGQETRVQILGDRLDAFKDRTRAETGFSIGLDRSGRAFARDPLGRFTPLNKAFSAFRSTFRWSSWRASRRR